MARLIVRFQPRVGIGGVITWQGDRANQAVFWELKSVNIITGVEGAPYGSLLYDRTHTDKSYLCTNIYTAPDVAPPDNVYDKVKVRWLS